MNAAFRFATRATIVLFWVSCIVLFLFLPKIIQYFMPERSITLLAWSQVIDGSYLTEFEKETGIKVKISYFEHNEELLTKLKGAKDHGYDLVMPSDYAVEQLIKEDLLQQIDNSKLQFWDTIYPTLLGHYFDPTNQYSIPIYWSVYGLGIDTDYFKGKKLPASWQLVFDENFAPDNICVLDDAREMILIAGQYLFGKVSSFTEGEIKQIKQLLLQQKKWVEIYSDFRPEFLLASKVCPIAMMPAADLIKVMRLYKNIDFIIPKEGKFVLIDSFVIPKTSTKKELSYQFLNFLYQKEIMQKYVDKFNFFPPITSITIPKEFRKIAEPTRSFFKKVRFFKNVIPEKILNELWIAIKA